MFIVWLLRDVMSTTAKTLDAAVVIVTLTQRETD